MKSTIAQNLLKLQERSSMTKKDFAASYGINAGTFSTYLCGRATPPIDLLIQICNEEGVSLDWLCGRDNDDKGPVNVSQFANTLYRLFDKVDLSTHVDYDESHYVADIYLQINAKDERFEKSKSFFEMLISLDENLALKRNDSLLTEEQFRILKKDLLEKYSTVYI